MSAAIESFIGTTGRVAISVSELNHAVARQLERHFPLVSVRGEIWNFTRAASGHWYFTLKDDQAQVRCAMFRGRAQYADSIPRDGDAVLVRAQVRLYEARGEYQLVVESLQPAGIGALLEAFERLKQRLSSEGLFDAERKRALPAFVTRVGIVTSSEAAALRDVARALTEHAPHVGAVVYATPVQGEEAAARIAAAIELANVRAECDVLIVCRGGGSVEDLHAFNDETTARAIAGSRIPVISGVGHETDYTIADFVADLRAPTPTAAARSAVQAGEVWLHKLSVLQRRLAHGAQRGWELSTMRLDIAAARLASPLQRLDEFERRVEDAQRRLSSSMHSIHASCSSRLQALQARGVRAAPPLQKLEEQLARLQDRFDRAAVGRYQSCERRVHRALDLLRVLGPPSALKRGYAIVRSRTGRVVSARDIVSNERFSIEFHDGTVEANAQTTPSVEAKRSNSAD